MNYCLNAGPIFTLNKDFFNIFNNVDYRLTKQGADDLALKLYRTEILSAVELYFWQFFTHAFIRRLTLVALG